MRINPGLRIWFFLSMLFANVNAYGDESWTGVTKSPGDYTSAGVVTITGAVTLNPGTYTFTTLIVNASRALTLSGDTATNSGVIINADSITVSGTISADSKGYAANTGPGVGPSTVGGCHGGFGGFGEDLVTMCDPYGSNLEPVTLGSGGGQAGSTTPGAGGGAIKLNVAGTLTVSGIITANGGAAGASSGGMASGGGAGGSIWINAGTLAGAGAIRANGGAGVSTYSGGGGGGLVAVYYGTSSYTGAVTANGGTSSANMTGVNGSAFLIDSTNNDLYINTSSMIGNGTYSFRNITIASGIYVSNQGRGYKANLGTAKGNCNGYTCSGGGHGGRGAAAGTSTSNVAGGGVYGSMLEPTTYGSGGGTAGDAFGAMGGGAIKMVASGTFTINGTIDSDGMYGYSISYDPGGGAGGSVWIVGANVLGSGKIQAVGGAGYDTGSAGSGGRIAVYYSGSFSSSLTFDVSPGSGAGITAGATVGSVVVVDTTNNNLYFPASSTLQSGTYTYNNITIAPSAKVWTLDGNVSGSGTGAGASNSGTGGGGGGGYGGAGAASNQGQAGGGTYGSSTAPVDLGSGGGSNSSRGYGGAGGGAIKLVITNTLTIGTGGSLVADGGSYSIGRGGGGSGGSIWIITRNISSVTNGITAKGGNGESGYGGGGGGGRIAIYYFGSLSGTVSVAGGTGYTSGSAGTSVIKFTGSPVWFFRGY
ncbi:hypothetical protein B9G69_000440 [Bdellovibrio sp. SKB1291214]|uniref:beta strand repeat-containing protein n=1 Tax=Bdellovibrio sp. SKB1291214 TaxID=1732569 RepID=UPI00223F131B|nr:hypothetical protein [Bdellovibrio sp. SKB1291214]UYL09042.1 hypothetical protein B9G69_000440 [Bdellovibrio sp. SKB1291214]